jgi:hypothetical protein
MAADMLCDRHARTQGKAVMSLANGCARLQPAIRGKIADPFNRPVASVQVRIRNSKMGAWRSALTGSEGSFMFGGVPPGVYTLEVALPGYRKLVQRGIAVQECSITGLGLRMDVAPATRSLKLSGLSLEYVDDLPASGDRLGPAPAAAELREAVADLRLEKALFNPPPSLRVGRRQAVEFGIYQSLREAIARRLQERQVELAEGEAIQVALAAKLQADGCLVLPASPPRLELAGPRYVEWRWEILPRSVGRGRLRLALTADVAGAGLVGLEKCLLDCERDLLIRRDPLAVLPRALAKLFAGDAPLGHPGR